MQNPSIAFLDLQVGELIAQLRISLDTKSLSWFEKRDIIVHDKSAFWILDRNKDINQWSRLCNGMVIRKPDKLVSMPVTKLETIGSKSCYINYQDTVLVEKILGKQIGVFWPFSEKTCLICHTNSAISTIKEECTKDTDLYKAKELISKLKYINLDVKYQYVFQFDGDDIYLVSGRETANLFEFTENELDLIAQRIGASRPLKFRCKGMAEIRNYINDRKEVFILRDEKTGERANAYVQLDRPKKIATCKYKRLLPIWVAGDHLQTIAQFPETKPKFMEIEAAALKIKIKVYNLAKIWLSYQLTNQGLEHSLQRASNVPEWAHKIILRLKDQHQERWEKVIHDWLIKMNYKKLLEILELK